MREQQAAGQRYARWRRTAAAAAVLSLACLAGLAPQSGDAAQFRSLDRILTPPKDSAPVEEGMVRELTPVPLPRQLTAKIIERLMQSWNSTSLRDFLKEEFQDRQRLLDTIRRDVPRDARLRVVGVQGVRVLNQHSRGMGRDRYRVVSQVSARLRVQIEFTDPSAGFQRIETSGEYLFRVTLVVRRK